MDTVHGAKEAVDLRRLSQNFQACLEVDLTLDVTAYTVARCRINAVARIVQSYRRKACGQV